MSQTEEGKRFGGLIREEDAGFLLVVTLDLRDADVQGFIVDGEAVRSDRGADDVPEVAVGEFTGTVSELRKLTLLFAQYPRRTKY